MTRRGRDEAARKRSAWRHFLAKQHARFTLHFLGLPPHGFAVDGNALPPSARFWGSIGHARWVIWALGGEDEYCSTFLSTGCTTEVFRRSTRANNALAGRSRPLTFLFEPRSCVSRALSMTLDAGWPAQRVKRDAGSDAGSSPLFAGIRRQAHDPGLTTTARSHASASALKVLLKPFDIVRVWRRHTARLHMTVHTVHSGPRRGWPRPPPRTTAHARAACIPRATLDVGPSISAGPLHVYQTYHSAANPGSTLPSAWAAVRALEESKAHV
ncbi:uncharacterized protein CC84DRAFT_1175423 [Paraphaeosphaeria sporulosa]|uniref:Uncharacterized protein n=1 Tax=Paraphaeosphaeria sporulosa TaxID=1460663 RepID=A0A177CJJ1_9PLEO|nr:uncharacterized protein CC84DRAFT_1175423 [Paraphaeosphaeria sporulosa]OAG07663.1 hypothetical protein CC84DRAFT_1175423 [Paraphaeosphaeria sporulosa]